jgi:3-oxoacyl-[acyl-carrier protein] reductase
MTWSPDTGSPAEMQIDLRGRRALVTGGSRGLGRAIARKLGAAGAEVAVVYRTGAEAAAETLARIAADGGKAWAERADVASERDVQRLFERVDREWPEGLDILVANAGIWEPTAVPVAELRLEQWRATLATNLDGVFLCTRFSVTRLRNDGRIVLISSGAGIRGEPYHADYAASKGALHSFARAVCVELAPRGITVNCVAPGWIDTEMVAAALEEAERARIEQRIPLGRIATCDDVASPVAFVCSPLARHMTGTVIEVTGGAGL